jgi:hypothetical protein
LPPQGFGHDEKYTEGKPLGTGTIGRQT